MPSKHFFGNRPYACAVSFKFLYLGLVRRELGLKRLTAFCNIFLNHDTHIVTTFSHYVNDEAVTALS